MTDLGPPATKTLARVSDPRAVQFWDKGRSLSREIVAATRKNPAILWGADVDEEAILWDWVAVFRAGTTWDRDSFPVPVFSMNPVVDGLGGLRASLTAAGPGKKEP